jgi:hypothetical protein
VGTNAESNLRPLLAEEGRSSRRKQHGRRIVPARLAVERHDASRDGKGGPRAAPHACARTNLRLWYARSPSLFGARLPGYCLPLLFHKLLTVHRFLEASDTVVGESATHGRIGPHQCSEPERSVARRFWSRQRDAKRLNPCSPILATWLSVSCACAAPASACAAPASASAAMAVRRRRFAVIRLPALRRPATASAAVSAGSRNRRWAPLFPLDEGCRARREDATAQPED